MNKTIESIIKINKEIAESTAKSADRLEELLEEQKEFNKRSQNCHK